MARGDVDDAARRLGAAPPELFVAPLGQRPALGEFLARDGGVGVAHGPRHLVERVGAGEMADVGGPEPTGYNRWHAHRVNACG